MGLEVEVLSVEALRYASLYLSAEGDYLQYELSLGKWSEMEVELTEGRQTEVEARSGNPGRLMKYRRLGSVVNYTHLSQP